MRGGWWEVEGRDTPAVKRYPTSKVREIQVRRQVLQEGIKGQMH